METKHTPWEACERGDYTDDGIVILDADMTRRIAVFNREDDAARAVHAVNFHDELVAALEGIVTHWEACEQGPGHSHEVPGVWDSDNHPGLAGTRCEWCAQWSRGRAAIAKAKPLATDDTSCNKPTGEAVTENDLPY